MAKCAYAVLQTRDGSVKKKSAYKKEYLLGKNSGP
jgi:hypothetical protein